MKQNLRGRKLFSSLSSSFEENKYDHSPLRNLVSVRGRQLYNEPRRYYNETNISHYSTCETKRIPPYPTITTQKPHNGHKYIVRHRKRSSEYDNFSQSSSSSREIFKNRRCEDEIIQYPTKKQYNLSSSEEDDHSSDNSLKKGFAKEIEIILIFIYNKNISNDCKKRLKLTKSEQNLKNSFKKLNDQYNITILRTLSFKIKELINKYKEKIFEIPEMAEIKAKIIQSQYQKTMNYYSENPNITNEAIEEDIMQNEITNILLRELINIKQTLRQSSIEIKNIFQYPLNIIEQATKEKYNIEQMQIEEFSKVLLNDQVISSLLRHFKEIFKKYQELGNLEIVEQVEEDKYLTLSEMTKFDDAINGKINFAALREAKEKQYAKELAKAQAKLKKKENYLKAQLSNDVIMKMKETVWDIDELVKFIDSDDQQKTKKKKKNKNLSASQETADKCQNDNNITKEEAWSNMNVINSNIDINESEIEDFKNQLLADTKSSYECQRLKPVFSKNWIENILCIK